MRGGGLLEQQRPASRSCDQVLVGWVPVFWHSRSTRSGEVLGLQHDVWTHVGSRLQSGKTASRSDDPGRTNNTANQSTAAVVFVAFWHWPCPALPEF